MSDLSQKKTSNRDDALAFDWAMRNSTALGGWSFFKARAPHILKENTKRWFVPTETLPDAIQAVSMGHKLRCCIQEDGGRSKFRCMWSKRGPAMHTVIDMGSASWPAQCLLYSWEGGQINGTLDCDPPHRRHRFHLNAIESSGNGEILSEVHLVLCVGAAPFGRSGFFGTIKGAAEEYFTNFNHTCVLFAAKYPRLSHAMLRGRSSPDYGTESPNKNCVRVVAGMPTV